jgi:2-oxoglutarate ferredoxin oxidoreductase subunit alpha
MQGMEKRLKKILMIFYSKIDIVNRITVKIAGPAGMGIKSAGLLLAKIVTDCGYYFADYSEYPSLVRGGHNSYQITYSTEEVFMVDKTADILVSLVKGHEEDGKNLWELPLPSNIYANTMAIGALVFRLGLDKNKAIKIIKNRFGDDGKNLEAFKEGFNFAQKNSVKIKIEDAIGNENKTMIVDGSEAVSWGMVKGGLNFFAGYPMTPVSGILHFLAKKQDEFKIKVIHPEDEIAVASMATGASIAGARSAVATSGGGFALMTETVSLNGAMDVGVVYVMGQRPGPATGMPTWTGQGELLFCVNAGHGEFAKIVLAPGSIEESFEIGRIAINLANKYDVPVIVLTDKMICEGATNTIELSKEKLIVEKSNKIIPGQGKYLYNSYEHDVEGFSVEDSEGAKIGMEARLKKLELIKKDSPKVLLLGSPKAKKLIVSWGSTKGAILEALKGQSDYAYLQVKTLWPIDKKIEKIINGFETKILIENNATGQLGQLLKSQMSINFDKTILKYNGRPFFPDELKEALL